ncbi:MAG TPA: pitrilysin family protein [Thermodesulfobacteriota bacterium]|nr:pitrilysin family protein [Thermodesulfobacteriota bacterium]
MTEPIVFTLPNGLTVVLQENHAAPVVAFNVWVRVGSTDETDSEAGIAHVIEHMLFKGTERRPVGRIAQEIEGAGGEINAFTSFDYTVYHIVIASRYARTALDVLADAVQHSTFDPAEYAREQKVVLEEILRAEDSPERIVGNTLFATAYRHHPYRRPVIGYSSVVATYPRDAIYAFYRKWYKPNNMTLVVVGDIDAQAFRQEVERAFSGFAAGPLPPRQRPVEPPQEGFRAAIVARPVSRAYLQLGWHIPGVRHDDVFALDVAAQLLGQGESSRLYQTVKVDKELVHSIYAYAFTPQDPGLFSIGMTLDAGKALEATRAALAEAFRLRHDSATPFELRKAKINIESEFVYNRETVEGQARNLGYFQTVLGDLGFQKTYLDRIARVTAEDVRRVARTYLTPDNLSIALLLPEAQAGSVTEADLARVAQEAFRAAEAEGRGQPAARPADGEVTRVVLDNGLRVLVKEAHAVPIVTMRIVFLGGVRAETERTAGLNNFLAGMLTKGTATRSAAEIAREIESIAGSLEGDSGRNTFGATATVLSRFLDEGLDLFADVVLNPAFPPAEIEKRRQDVLAAIRAQEDNPSAYVFRLFARALFPAHPYGLNTLGTEASIRALTRDDLVDYYRRFAAPNNAVLAVVGDVSTPEILERLKAKFGAWPRREVPLPTPPPQAPHPAVTRVEEVKPKAQAQIVVGNLGTTVTDPDRYALQVLNAVLSGQGGRLFYELRDRESLAYALSSFSIEGLEPGAFGVYIGTAPDKVPRALAAIERELERVRTERVAPEELERAKRYLIGSFEIDLQRGSATALTLALNELYGVGYEEYRRYAEKINAVTADDVLRVARKVIQPERYTVAIIRPAEAASVLPGPVREAPAAAGASGS